MDNKLLNDFKKKLTQAVQTAKERRMEEDRRRLLSTVGQDVAKLIEEPLRNLTLSAKASKETMRDAMMEALGVLNARELNIDTAPLIEAIEHAMGNVVIPEPRVTVTVPEIKIPSFEMPKEMDIKGFVSLLGVDLNNPLPVQIRDANGKPVSFGTMSVNAGPSSGKHDYFTIKGFAQSAFAEISNPDGRVKVELPAGSSGLTDTELRAAHLDVQQVSGSIDSTNVVQFGGDALAKGAEANAGYLRTILAQDAGYSVSATQVGTWNIGTVTTVTGVTNSLAAAVIDSSGVQYSGSNPLPITGTVIVSSVTATTGSALVDSTGVQYSGSNPVPISGSVSVTGSLTSTVVTGPVVSDALDDNSAPVQIGGIARTANPTAVAAGDAVKASYDDLGRQVIRPLQVRDLLLTSYTALANGTETAMLAGVSGEFHDLISVVAANESTAAVVLYFRPSTGGTILLSLDVPASGTAGVNYGATPYPQPFSDSSWTVDMGDFTGTTVNVTATYSKEV